MNVIDKLRVAYPRDFTGEHVEFVWADEFRHHDSGKVWAAVNGWIHDNRRAPTIADIHERIRANSDHRDVQDRLCGFCDHGWTWVDGNTVARCPNGCLPPVRQDMSLDGHKASKNTPDYIRTIREGR